MNIEGNKEQFILNIIDASVDGILAFDLECRYTVWNSTMESISGISREQAIGSYAFDLFPFLKETGEDQFFFQALSGQKVRSKDRVYKIPETDREGLFNAYYAPSYNEEGKIIGGIGIIRDITDRRRAEEALGISELRFRSMIEQSPLSVQIFSPDGTTIQVNRAWEELWGVRLEQIQGYNILKDKQLVTAGIMPYIEKAFNGEATSIPAILYNPEDTIPNITKHKDPKRWVQAYIYPVKDDQGTIKEVVLMHEDITEQKYAEETAKESTNRLTFTLEASQIGDWSWNAVTDVVTFSERAAEIFGIPPGPYMTWTQMQELLHKEDREKVRMAVNTVVTNREYYDIEYRVVRPNDGRECWVWAKGKPTYNSKDELLGMTGIVQDITNRKLTEERLRLITQAIHDAVWDWNLKTNEVWWSEGIRHLFGYKVEDISPNDTWWYEHIHPDDRERIVSNIHSLINSGEKYWSAEYRYQRADGNYRYVFDRGHIIHDSEGHPARMVGAMIDISDRKRAEEELREETNTLETINRISQLMAAELDLQKLLQYITDACTELTRAEFGAFFYNVKNENGGEYALYTLSGVPRHAFENFPLPRATELFGPTFRGEETICIDDVKLDPRYGKNPPFYGMPSGHLPVSSYLAVPVISRSGEVIGGLFFGHSKPGVFTERDKKIVVGIAGQSSVAIDNARLFETAQGERDRAKEASRLKDDFIATVSHELRTPLTSMLGWSRMLRTGKLDQATSTRALETIERNAQMQAQLIEDLLDISRIISGKMKLDIQPLEPIQVVESALDSIKPAMEAKNIRLKSVLNPDTGPILADPTRLQQIIWNLLSNAVKFTPKDGRVELQLIRVGSNIKIIVSDTGRGIDPDFLPYVFERFRQADTRSTRREGGLGLGLSIVINLVELHGGTIEAHSEGVGKGATFTVTLPLMAIHKQKTNEKFQSIWSESLFECPPAIKGVRVLILDDEPDTRELLAALLEECKAQVLAVSSAAEALDKIEGFKPDVIVSDIEMPDVNGYEFIRQLRATKDKNHRIPVIALTAYARTEDRMRALSAGFQMHVPKPVEPAELIMVIASLVEQSRK